MRNAPTDVSPTTATHLQSRDREGVVFSPLGGIAPSDGRERTSAGAASDAYLRRGTGLEFEMEAAWVRKQLSPTIRTVVDVGCGTGGMGRALSAAVPGCRRVGFDYAARALELARGSGFLGLAAADANALPLRDACADAAVCLDVLSCRGVNPAEALSEIRRCLKPGGVAVLNVPAFPALRGRHDAAADVHRRLLRGELRLLLSKAGLAPVSVRYWNATLAAGMLAWRGVSRLIPGEPVSDVGLTPPRSTPA